MGTEQPVIQRLFRLAMLGSLVLSIAVRAENTGQGNTDSAKLISDKGSNTLVIDSGRPLMRAALILQALYGYVITYEDPRYVNDDDVVDIAPTTRKDFSSFRPGKAPKLNVPRSAAISVDVPTATKISSDDLAKLLHKLISLQGSQSHGGHFRVTQDGDAFHILPSEVRDRAGNWETQSSPLDALISIPQEERSEKELYRAIVEAINATAKVRMHLSINHPMAPANSDMQTSIGATNETARSVLTRALAVHRTKRTWVLMHTTEEGPYSFSLIVMDIPTDVAAVSY
jgi:hypothetical protein